MALDKDVLALLMQTKYASVIPAGALPVDLVFSTPLADAIVTHIGTELNSIIIQGNWNATTNVPDITGTLITGYAWIVDVAGATNLGGITTWVVGDWAVKSAVGWSRIQNIDVSAVWGNITGTLANQLDLQNALNAKVDENAAIVAGTKTKITYDTKGLVTVGADATTADIADSVDKRYVTDADAIVIGNTSGTNTGYQQGDGVTITGAGTAIDPFVGAGTVAGDYQRLGVAAIAVVDTDETLYTVPALTYIRSPKLYITNTNGGLTTKVKVAHVDGAIGALADEDYVLFDDYFLPYETKIIELDGMIATDTIIITSSQLLVNFDLCGEVLAADVNMKRVDAIDIDGAGNLVDTDYVAWLTTRACKVNMLVCNRNGGDVAEVQIAYIDDNIIGSILDEERKYFTLDVNQTLFLEMDMNMEDDKVVSFRSNMANVNCIVYTVA